jgi:putative transcriptional regulator
MAKVEIAQALAGRLLIAMPGLGDTRFQRSVILICAHSADGAMGLIINKPVVDMSFHGLLEQLDILPSAKGRDIRVRFGGPVERGRGFVLHSADWEGEDLALEVPGGLRMTATLDILRALAGGAGPQRALLALGYSGWGPGQLEAEILRNDWLICDPAQAGGADLVFSDADPGKWGGALRMMGVDPVTLSGAAGRA